MKKYTVADLQHDLSTKTMSELLAMKNGEPMHAYKIIDLKHARSTEHYIDHEPNTTKTLAEYLAKVSYAPSADLIEINLQPFAVGSWFGTADDMNSVWIETLDEQDEQKINRVVDWALEFSRDYSKYFWYMKEYGNGSTEKQAAIYNLYAYSEHEQEAPDDAPIDFAEALQILDKIDDLQKDFVKRDIGYYEQRAKRREEFNKAFRIVFDNTLRCTVDLELDHEKPGGIHEQAAVKLAEDLGGYNEYTADTFKAIVDHMNSHYTADYPRGNCNRGIKNWTMLFGRESSMVMYLRFWAKSADEVEATRDELSEFTKADEITVKECNEIWKNKYYATIRLWWD